LSDLNKSLICGQNFEKSIKYEI